MRDVGRVGKTVQMPEKYRSLTLGPKYVKGKRRVANDVETLPSGSVTRVEDSVSQEGSSCEACVIEHVGALKEVVSREREIGPVAQTW